MSSLDTIPSLRVDPSAAGCEPAVILTDESREQLIEAWRVVVELDDREGLKRLAAARMADLIGERSPAQVRRMEEARGLR